MRQAGRSYADRSVLTKCFPKWLVFALGVLSGFSPISYAAPSGGGMTLQEARSRIPDRQLPEFWVGDVRGLKERFDRLRTGTLTVIGVSPGGRPIQLVSFGAREDLPSHANFNSAVGGRDPSAYMDKKSRSRPVILFVGPVHGQEVEGLTGLVNLIQVAETGFDLAGREHEELMRLARRCRLLIIPAGNPDGIARFEPRALQGMTGDDLRFWGQGTWKDGTFCDWPQVKRLHPMREDRVGFVGCYFDDKGINPMHDEFFAPMGPEAPAILRLARDEAPDLAVSLHSHENNPAVLRPAYESLDAQNQVKELAAQVYSTLESRGLPRSAVFTVGDKGGETTAPFNLVSALFHISGAPSFTFECPHGLVDDTSCHVDLTQILDIQLTLYESMIRFALEHEHARGKSNQGGSSQ